jgi:hypothetical protein
MDGGKGKGERGVFLVPLIGNMMRVDLKYCNLLIDINGCVFVRIGDVGI